MVDPTSDLGEDVTEETAPACETCGEKIVQRPTHRVVSRVEEGRAVQYHFCSADCRATWLAE